MAKKQKTARTSTRGKARLTPEVSAVVNDLVVGNRILYVEGIVDSYGHISARDPRNPERFLMSRARAPGMVTVSDIMEFDLDGEPVHDDDRPIYSERFIHSEIYRVRPDVMAVVHSHSPTVIPFSVTQVPLKPIRGPFLYPEVPVFDTRATAGWTNLLISNPALGKALAQTLGQNSVALMRGHGDVVVASSVRKVVYRAIYTEANAKLLLQAKMLGGPITYLAPEEAALMDQEQARDRPGHGSDRTWEMWKQEALARTGSKLR